MSFPIWCTLSIFDGNIVAMSIQEWFDTGCNYESGIVLFSKLSNNKALLRLFQSRKSSLNVRKLQIELRKIQTQNTPVQKQPVSREIRKIEQVKIEASPENKVITSKPISSYPVELHDTYKLRIQTFLKAATLKLQLNEVDEEDTETALSIQEQIWALFKKNEKCWKILDHYDETGQILPTKSKKDFSKLSAQALVNQRQRLYVSVSKRRKTIEKMEEELESETNEAIKERLQKKIRKKIKELQSRQNDIDALSKLIKDE